MSWLVGLLLVGAAAAAVGVWWLRDRLLIVTVHGPSMTPTYRDGERVLVRRASGPPGVGQVVVVDLRYLEQGNSAELGIGQSPISAEAPPTGMHPGDTVPPPLAPSRLIKRVAAVAGDRTPAGVAQAQPVVPPGMLVLLGDNASASVDSRHYGYVPVDKVMGAVVRRMA